METLTRADLTESVYRNIGLSRNESSELVEAVLEEVCACLEKGEEVIASVEDNFQMALNNLSQANFRSFVYAKMDEKSQIWEMKSI